jgi:hypothetical protein
VQKKTLVPEMTQYHLFTYINHLKHVYLTQILLLQLEQNPQTQSTPQLFFCSLCLRVFSLFFKVFILNYAQYNIKIDPKSYT